MTKTICSIYFQPLIARRPYAKTTTAGFMSQWEIPASKRGEYQTITISDAHEHQKNGSEQEFRTPVYADHLAADLVQEWRDNRRFQEVGRIGVFVCAGDKPTPEEIDSAQTAQDLWCEAHYNEAEDMFANGGRAGINKLHRDCAIYLGRESAEWVYNVKPSKLISCPMCTARVDDASIVCRECGNVIDFDRYLAHQEKMVAAQARIKEIAEKHGINPNSITAQAQQRLAAQQSQRK